MRRARALGWFLFAGLAFVFGADAPNRGIVVATAVSGDVVLIASQARRPLSKGDALGQGATVRTGKNSSAKFTLSNGVVLHLAAESEFALQEFFQENAHLPSGAVMAEEPSISRVKWVLIYGAVVGRVPRLHYDRGSRFAIATRIGELTLRDPAKPITPPGSGSELTGFTEAAFKAAGYVPGADNDAVFRVAHGPGIMHKAEVQVASASGDFDFVIVDAGGAAFQLSAERQMTFGFDPE